jgi:hypothetical protein
MRPVTLILTLLLSTITGSAQKRTPATTAGAVQAKDILSKAYVAMGGKALTAMRDMTQSVTETSFLPQGTLKYEMEIVYGRPARLLLKTRMEFGDVTSGYDGTTGWTKNPMGVQRMNPLQLADMKMMIARNLDHLLQNFRGSEYTLSYLGQDKIGGKPVDILRAFHRATKTSITLSIDAQSFLVVKKISQRRGESGLVDFVDEYSDYRDVKGVKVAFATTTSTGGNKIGEMVVHSVKINSGLSARFFAEPNR